MLSRLRHAPSHESEILVIDTAEWVDPSRITDENIADTLPLIHDGLDLAEIATEQKSEFDQLCILGADDENDDYQFIRGVLYSTRTPRHNAPSYPRLVLPTKYRAAVIDRAHKDVGHMSAFKTISRLTEAYVWPGLLRSVRERIGMCPICVIHGRHTERPPMGDMPIPAYPMQIVGADLIGPLPESTKHNKYALTIIDHLSGWAEAFALPDKTNQSVWNAFANYFIPRHGIPEILITDNGKEFTAHEWERYLAQIGVQHNVTTPVHPQSNGKIERFNRTLKEILQKLMNNNPAAWEDKLGDALYAYRNAVSVTNGHTPFYLLYGRDARVPLSRTLNTPDTNVFGNRLDDLGAALKTARHLTADSRRYNRERLAERANAKHLTVGDRVVVKAEERITFSSRWDPYWIVTRTRDPVVWLQQQQTGKTKILNREKVKLVDPSIAWDECNPRPVRAQYRPRTRHQQPVDDDRESSRTVSNRHTPALVNRPARRPPTPDGVDYDQSDADRVRVRKRRRVSVNHHQSPPPPDLDESPCPSASTTSHHGRPIRARQLSRRARELLDTDDLMDDDSQQVHRHFLKRTYTPRTAAETASDNKRARWEAACYSRCWYGTPPWRRPPQYRR